MKNRTSFQFSPGALGPLLESDSRSLDWHDLAECQYVDPELFFPEKGGSTREAKKICRGCVVREKCLEWALENDERFGVFGALSERERRRIKPKAAGSGPGPRPCGHARTPDNSGKHGHCLTCQRRREARYRIAERAARTGSVSPYGGRRNPGLEAAA